MQVNRCLYCYQPLAEGQVDFHPSCSRKIFGTATPPLLTFDEAQMNELALQVVRSHITVTGVQPKLSLDIVGENKQAPKRFTIAGLGGRYILKPPTEDYPHLPEVEDLTMHLAALANIDTVPHSLIRLQSGSLAYITQRIDRLAKGKLHMEDMCQLTERLTEDKYRSSYEQIAKAILQYSANPVLDVVDFFEQVLFSFLTGNADMHPKKFSLLHRPGIGYQLAPAYDMVATALLHPADKEDLALTLNGKKKKIKRDDFMAAFATAKLRPKQADNILAKLAKAVPRWLAFINEGFLPNAMKAGYQELITERQQRLYG